jgi:hypothetical protein
MCEDMTKRKVVCKHICQAPLGAKMLLIMLFLSSTTFSSECVVFGVIISPTKKGGRDALVVVLRSGRRQLRERERGERGRFEFAELEEVNT